MCRDTTLCDVCVVLMCAGLRGAPDVVVVTGVLSFSVHSRTRVLPVC